MFPTTEIFALWYCPNSALISWQIWVLLSQKLGSFQMLDLKPLLLPDFSKRFSFSWYMKCNISCTKSTHHTNESLPIWDKWGNCLQITVLSNGVLITILQLTAFNESAIVFHLDFSLSVPSWIRALLFLDFLFLQIVLLFFLNCM